MTGFPLDELGWDGFEALIQALLKARLGLGVEAWGGHGDWGRDAYIDVPLKFPTAELSPGPFVFQCKFVEKANAAGARSSDLVVGAVRRECHRILKRLAAPAKWPHQPNHYVFFTNAPISPSTRAQVSALLTRVLPDKGEARCRWCKSFRS